MLSNINSNYSNEKFAISFPGILKLLAILLFITSSIIFLSDVPLCSVGKPAYWYSKLYPISAVSCGVLVTLFYIFLAIGTMKKTFYIWTIVDLILNTITFIVMLIISIITTTSCENSTSYGQLIPGPMGILGSLLLAISSAVWYVQNRISKEINVATNNNNLNIDGLQFGKSTIA